MTQQFIPILSFFIAFVVLERGLSIRFRFKQGKSDFFLGKSAPDDMQRFFGFCEYFIIFYYLLLLVNLYNGFDFWGITSKIRLPGGRFLELVGYASGTFFIGLKTIARLNLGSSWRIGLDHNSTDQLVTRGFYRYLRNPYFTFLLGFQISIFVIAPNTVSLFAFIQSALLLGLQVRQEELFLSRLYGERYRVYKSRTGRFLPRLGGK